MFEAAASIEESSTVNLACFEIKGQIYAIEVEHVREIVRIMEITPLPNAPSLIEGVIDLRGAVIPIMDLVRVLNRGSASAGMHARIIVLEVDGLALGLWVDAAPAAEVGVGRGFQALLHGRAHRRRGFTHEVS